MGGWIVQAGGIEQGRVVEDGNGVGGKRQGDLAFVDRVLSSPQAAAAARSVGADLDAVRRAAPTLTDAELREIAARAAALDRDPVAGVSDSDIRWLLYIFLIVAIVILVIKAVD